MRKKEHLRPNSELLAFVPLVTISRAADRPQSCFTKNKQKCLSIPNRRGSAVLGRTSLFGLGFSRISAHIFEIFDMHD